MVSHLRVRKSNHSYYWLEEQRQGTWLIIDSFRERKAARLAAAEELAGRSAWRRHQGHKGRISWVFKDDWRLSIWHKQVLRDRPYILLDEHQRELQRFATLNQARIALLLCRAELP